MSRWHGTQRAATDWGFVGGVIGLVVSILVGLVAGGLSIWLDMNNRDSVGRIFSACLLRLIALLVVTLGMGIGYMTARAIAG